MPTQTTVTRGGTQVTKRTPEVVPNLDEKCQAIVRTEVIICEPMSDGTWRLVTSFKDAYNLLLNQRGHDAARKEVVERMQEMKQKWNDNRQIISLENLLTTGRPNSLKMEGKTKLPVPAVEKS